MSDTLDFLRNKRNRATVPIRDKSLIDSQANEENATGSSSRFIPLEISENQARLNPISAIESELNELPEIARRSNIRVEANLLEQAEQDFKKERITLETFFEAAYSIAMQSPDLKQKIFTEARSRKKLRDRAGQLRRDLARLSSY
jgi:hypothetical protein